MSNTPNKPTFRGKAARIIMAGTLAIAFAPALPAFADDTATAGDAAATDTATQVTSWANLYKSLGIDTTSGYDAVTSATNFTGHHVKDIPTIVHRTTNAEGATTSLDGIDSSATTAEKTVQVKLGSAEFEYQPDSTHGTGTFLIYPDDTVEGYTWNEYLNNTYAVTVSDGTTTVGAVPWIDYYGENSTSGYHYNKLEVALNNGTSVASNEANVTRFASFYDENGNVKAGTYTITVYSKGYSDLTAQVTVLPTYAGASVSGTSKATNSLCLSNLPSDIKDAKVTVSYTTGHGRNAITTYLAGSADGGADIPDSGVIALDPAALAAVENGTQLDVVVSNSNYAPISLTSKVADTATFPNTLKASASTKTVKAKKVAKKKQTVSGAIKVSGAQGKVTYAKVAKGSSKKLSVNKTNGKITVKKGTKKGTYKIKVKVTAAGNADFASASKTVTAKIKVK